MAELKYTALIRTNNSFPLVSDVILSLRSQTVPPTTILAVDSASTPEQRGALDEIFDHILDYPDEQFNFSKAINIGTAQINTEFVLIISSHVVLDDVLIIEKGIKDLKTQDSSCFGCCFNPNGSPEISWASQKVDKRNFTPELGFSNSCAFIKVKNVLERPFREDVFSAEDQEWAAYYLRAKNASFLSITSHKVKYLNKHVNDLKKINEEVAMAYFTHRQLLSPSNITARFIRSLIALLRKRPDRAKFHYAIAKELLLSRFRKPVKKSSYY